MIIILLQGQNVWIYILAFSVRLQPIFKPKNYIGQLYIGMLILTEMHGGGLILIIFKTQNSSSAVYVDILGYTDKT